MAPEVEKPSDGQVPWNYEYIGHEEETHGEKMSRKLTNNPFVPLGCVLTTGILVTGLISFIRGNKRQQQLLMRARVIAQGSTVLALAGGVGYQLYTSKQDKEKSKEK